MKINSANEWDPIKSIVVGIADHANFPVNDKLFTLAMQDAGWTETPPPSGPVPQYIIDETNEDLDELAQFLDGLGINVYRPIAMDFTKTDGQYSYCPRDNLLVIDDLVIEAPMSTSSRQHESIAFTHIKRRAIADGNKWIAAPVPALQYSENVQDGKFKLNNLEPVFDAANVCRFGKDLLYLVSSSANEMGAVWLQSVLGDEYNVHTTDVYDAAHIDSTILAISEDTILVNASRVTDENLPAFLKGWNKIYITDDMIVPQDFFAYPYASKWIAINMLAIGHKTIICDKNQPAIIAVLEQHGFVVIPLELRHSRTLGGGFHCVTLDLCRRINA